MNENFVWNHTVQPEQLPTDQELFLEDIEVMNQADIIIAEVTGPSHGVGRELAYAQHVCQIPVICFHHQDTKPSSMLMGNDYLAIQSYNDIDDIRTHLAHRFS